MGLWCKPGGHCIDGFERFKLAFALALRRGPSDGLDEAISVAVGRSRVVGRYLQEIIGCRFIRHLHLKFGRRTAYRMSIADSLNELRSRHRECC